jgi:NTE family protein
MLNVAFGRRVALLLIGSMMGWTAPAQEPAAKPKRPRIGLVLEGGGALGFAHIGVIQYLEAHHIPVDYVAGTSMGGLVGGLYAAGNGPEDLKKFVGDIDWSQVLSGQIPFPALSFRRKEDKLAFPNRLEFGIKKGIALPTGLNSGSAVNLLFDKTLLPYYDLKSFDDLPIPFRCVATDITTGEPHVFKDGPLPRALRATMSIPGLFAPVRIGNDLYTDGGAVDNLPVDVAQEMGAQEIIAVYLDTGPVDPEKLNSLLAVAGRNVEIMIAANEAKSLKTANIVIRADVSKFASSDFVMSAEIIPQGLKAAEGMAAELDKYSVSNAEWEDYVAQRNARKRTQVPVPKFVEVAGLKGMDQSQVAASFKQYVGKPLEPKKVEATIADLEGTGIYSGINFNIVDRNNEPGLLIRPLKKGYAPPFLNIGLTLSSIDSNNLQLGAGARVTFMNLAGPGSEVRIGGQVGQVAGMQGELYKPIVAGKRFFWAPHGYLAHTLTAYYSGSQQLAQYREVKNGLGGDIAYQFNSKTELRIGEDYQWFSETRTVGTPIEQEFDLRPFVTKVAFNYYGQNEVMVPSRGTIIQTYYNYFTQKPNDTGGYSQLNLRSGHFIPVKQRNIIFGTLSGGTSFGASNLGLAGFQLGGPLRLSAYNRGELLGNDYFLIQGGYLYQLTRLNPVLGDQIYAGGFFEIGKIIGGNLATPNLPSDVAGAIIVKTLIGPLYGGIAANTDHFRWYFGLGRVF